MIPMFIQQPGPQWFEDAENWICVDFEVDPHEDHGHARRKANDFVYGFALDSSGRRFHFNNLLDVAEFPWLKYSYIIAHNAKFEFQWMDRAGVPVNLLLPWCTQLAEYVIGGNRTGEGYWPLSLAAVSERYGLDGKMDLIGSLFKKGALASEINQPILKKYCQQDVQATIEVFKRQHERLTTLGLLPVFFLRSIFLPVVADMEMKGMHLDHDVVEQEHNALVSRYSEIESELHEITGGINMNSPKQKAWFMYGPDGLKLPLPKNKYGKPLLKKPSDIFPEGVPSTDKEAVLSLRSQRLTNPQRRFIDLLAESQKLSKRISSYTKKFVSACENDDCLLYGGLSQTITKTHRLASSPNLQNIARSLKKCFNARNDGWKLANADYAQLEFRTAGILSGDKQVLQDIHNSADVHSFTASVIFGDKFTQLDPDLPARKELRNQAKAHTFKPLYGGSSGTPKEQEYYKAFKEKYPGVAEVQRKWVEECLDTGQLRAVTGLISYFPGTRYDKGGYIINSTKILNLPVQQFATADIAPLGVTFLWHYMEHEGMESFLVNEVHDSCIAEIAPGEEEQFKQLAQKCMVDLILNHMPDIIGFNIEYPLAIDVSIGENWNG